TPAIGARTTGNSNFSEPMVMVLIACAKIGHAQSLDRLRPIGIVRKCSIISGSRTRASGMAMMAVMNHPRPCIALIVAAGRGLRAGEGVPKQYRQLAGMPVLTRAIAAFAAHPAVDGISVVIGADDANAYEAATKG